MDDDIARWSAAPHQDRRHHDDAGQKQDALEALDTFKSVLRRHLAERRGCPHAGLIGRALAAEETGVLDEEETLTNLVSMLLPALDDGHADR